MSEVHLTDRCWKMWNLILWVWFLITTALSLLLLLVNMGITAIVIGSLLVVFLLSCWYMRLYWRAFSYSLDDRELRVYCGVWWRKQVLIPFTRITNVNIIQGPWQRSRGLATLKVETAGASGRELPESQLWSQERYSELRDEILARVTTSSTAPTGDGTSDEIPESEGEPSWAEAINLLMRIEENTRRV